MYAPLALLLVAPNSDNIKLVVLSFLAVQTHVGLHHRLPFLIQIHAEWGIHVMFVHDPKVTCLRTRNSYWRSDFHHTFVLLNDTVVAILQIGDVETWRLILWKPKAKIRMDNRIKRQR